jgi:phosphoribosylamine--glycine ligase
MNILVLGTGGREHALAWKIAQSPRCRQLYLHPGNPGTRSHKISALFEGAGDLPRLLKSAREKSIDLVVIGPEAMLAEGYADQFRKQGFLVVGPNQAGALLETSKIYAKEFMVRAGIPTAPFKTIESLEQFRQNYEAWDYPLVIKVDGLAAGKGVVVATTPEDAQQFSDRLWQHWEFGPSPRVLVENFIEGREISVIGLCDGKSFVPLSSATDYKRVGEANTGPNTGGMGCISPSPFMTQELEKLIEEKVSDRVLKQMASENLDYRGALYLGLMITPEGLPYVLEFNARFGDPETQSLVLRLESDLLDLLLHTARATLNAADALRWREEKSVYVVAAAAGYPTSPTLGDPIEGLNSINSGAQIFFSGVHQKDGALVTGGGRVLGVGALGSDFAAARRLVYRQLENIRWAGQHFRKDIGA